MLTMAIGLVIAAGLFVLAALFDAPWLAVIAVLFVGFALVQRDRYLFQGAGRVVFVGVAVAVALGFLVARLT